MVRLVVGFLPWIVLGILGERSLSLALGLGLIVAIVAPAAAGGRATPAASAGSRRCTLWGVRPAEGLSFSSRQP